MSDNKTVLDAQEKENEFLLKLSRETIKKRTYLDAFKISDEYQKLISNSEQTEKFEKINVDKSIESIQARGERLKQESEELAESLKYRQPFISSALSRMAPFSYTNLLLVCGKTGEGKSTTVANIAIPLIKGGKKVLIITNEEREVDVMNRISCIELGFDYGDYADFTEGQKQKLSETRDSLLGQVTVIDQNFNNNTDFTTTLEGIKSILNSLVKNSNQYDAIIIDYYQKITTSKLNPKAASWEVLEKLSIFLDNFRKIYKAPIVLMCQLHPNNNEDTEIETRIKSGKSIAVVSTFIVEIKPNFQDRTTEWICHKKRMRSISSPLRLVTKLIDGRFVDYDPEKELTNIINNKVGEE